MKPPPGLLAVLFLGILPSCLLANREAGEAHVEQRLAVTVEHALFASLWVEIFDAEDRPVAAWYLPWDDDAEVVAGMAPLWIEQLLLEGWSGFALEVPRPGIYRVVVTSLAEVWSVELFAEF